MRHFDMAGTPYFMSPEAVSGRDVDHHSDVWSFAGLLQMVTGRAPFQALRYRSREALWRHIVDPRRESPLAVEQRLFPESESGVFARHDSCALEISTPLLRVQSHDSPECGGAPSSSLVD